MSGYVSTAPVYSISITETDYGWWQQLKLIWVNTVPDFIWYVSTDAFDKHAAFIRRFEMATIDNEYSMSRNVGTV
jgi:hypothetical protein